MNKKRKVLLIKISLIVSLIILFIDLFYRNLNKITYLTKEKCILYQTLPRPLFLFLEHYVELTLFIFLGIFLAMLLEQFFSKYKFFYPKNPFSAFIYASLLPICSCTAIPILKTLKEKINLRTLITFVIAAPLLSPPIIVLSFSVLGVKYGIFRILASMVLAISLGYIAEFFYHKINLPSESKILPNCNECNLLERNIYLRSYYLFKPLIPYIILAGTIGLFAELFIDERIIANLSNVNSIFGIMAVSIIGIPIYLCNGADILILRPFLHSVGLGVGTAITFSLTSTAICFTSAIMLSKFIGKRLTIILLIGVFLISTLLGYLINFI
jgi:uncharacterized protein